MSKNQIKFKAISDISIKADGSDFIIEGYGAIFGNIDSYNDIVEPGAFTKTLQEMKDRIALCYQHDIGRPIGKMLLLQEDSKGLFFQARVSDAEPEIKQKISENILKEFSIGYSTIKYDLQDMGENQRPICRLKELKLWEISLVTIAANPLATLQGIKNELGLNNPIDELDRYISNEKEHARKFELLKIKALFEAQPDNSTSIEEPRLSAEDIYYFNNRLKLI